MSELKPGWRRVKFGEVVRQVKDRVNPQTAGLKRFVAGEHMDTDDLRIRRWGDVGDGYLGPAFHAHFRPGQVLYGSRRTYLRKVSVADFEGVCANTTFVLESANPEVLLPGLLPFIMQTEAFHEHSKRESKGSVNPYVNFTDLTWYEFALPPMEEQRRALFALTRSLALVETSRDLHSQVPLLRSAWLRKIGEDLLRVRAHNVALGELLDRAPEGGCSAPERDAPTGCWVLGLSALSESGYVDGQLKAVDPTPAMKAAKLIDGDLLISRSNTRERVGFVGRFVGDNEEVSFPDTMMRLHPRASRVSADYLEMILQTAPVRGRMQAIAAGTSASMKKINRTNLLQIRVAAPAIHAQQKYIENWTQIRARERDTFHRTQLAASVHKALVAKALQT